MNIIVGGNKSEGISAADNIRVNNFVKEINSALGTHYQSFTIVKGEHQCVAGTNHFYHLYGNPGGDPITITLFEALECHGGHVSLDKATKGHNSLSLSHGQ